MTVEERATLVEAVADQVDELARAQNRSPQEILDDMRKLLLIQRFRSFISGNKARADINGWSESDVQGWIEEDRREQRRQ